MKKKLFPLFGALLLACGLPLSGTAANNQPFLDVPSTKHFAEAVNDLAARNIIGGYPDGTFKPGNTITRGQAAAIIAKMLKLDLTDIKESKFNDVSTASGYYKVIGAMAEAGFINGYGDGNFGPNDPVKRSQIASILVKAFDLPQYTGVPNPFTDVPKSMSHSQNILIIYKLGITTGTTASTFKPNSSITRGQAAKMIKATEDTKPAMLTLNVNDYGWSNFTTMEIGKADASIYAAILVKGRNASIQDKIQLVPLKEGTGTLRLYEGRTSNPKNFKSFIVHVKKTAGQLELTLEETDEQASSSIVTLLPSDYGLEDVEVLSADETNSGVYNSILVAVEPGSTQNKIQLAPLKEGTGTLLMKAGRSTPLTTKKFYVHVKKVGGELKLTVEETEDSIATRVSLLLPMKEAKQAQSVALYTMEGEKISDRVDFEKATTGFYTGFLHFTVDDPGQYIATVRLTGGKEVRYGIEAKAYPSQFYYIITSLREKRIAVYEEEDGEIGKHTLATGGEQIATIARDPGTNIFRVTAKQRGYTSITYEFPAIDPADCEGEWSSCFTKIRTGIDIKVEQMGSIIHTKITRSNYDE